MSVSRSASGFFTPYLNQAYSLVGGHFPYSAYIGGWPFIGKLWDIFSKDGRGLDRIIMEAAQVADENNGLAWWRFGPYKNVALVVMPTDIQSIILDHHDDLHLHDSTGSFKMFFGPESIFDAPVGTSEWKTLRTRFLNVLYNEKALKQDVQPMQKIISKYEAELTSTHSVHNLEQFCSAVTMDMIGLKLGLHHISAEDKKQISEMVSEGAVEVANGWDQIVAPYIPGYDFEKTRLAQIVKKGHGVLRKIIGENKANPELNEQDIQTYLSNASIYDITQFMVAGHETTAKLLLMTLLLLADPKHDSILKELRNEIERQTLSPENWTRSTVNNLPYMDAFVNEVLRLYPPIPDMIYKIKNPFTVADGTANFKTDDIVVISQRTTGWSKKVWGDDAAEFKPERFIGVDKKDLTYKHFPFGFAPKHCVGQLFSKQEVALTLGRLVKNFDFKLENEALEHPFPFHQVFTLRMGLDNIAMQFNRREPQQAARRTM